MAAKVFRNFAVTLEMIKWEHSLFALPFALCGALLAAGGWPRGMVLFWIVVAMVAARSAAMAFNRLADQTLDAANPRTQSRALPAGRLTRRFVIVFVLFFCGLFVFAALRLNRLAFYLAPAALAVALLYSYTKRFTRWSHLVLGLALGIAPAAAWIAVRGSLDPRILVLTLAVTLWVAGFDILYACQDCEFDRHYGLHSIPQQFGVGRALLISRFLHALVICLLWVLLKIFGLGIWAMAGTIIAGLLLAWEHSLVSATNLTRLNAAFFTMNGVIAVVFFCFVAADLLVR